MGDVFRALADESRRLILDELAVRDGQTLFEICSLLISRHGINSSRQAISQHLAVLESAGLITVRWQGRSKFHYFNREPLVDLTQRWLNPRRDTS
jgi:DNA-binding transcriptional ArsR family regulator